GIAGRSDEGPRRPPDSPLARASPPELGGDRTRVPLRLRSGGEDRPPGRLLLRVGTCAGGLAGVRGRARDGAALRRGGLGRRHGRRAGGDGGGEPRLPRGRRALGRLRDRASAPAADEMLHRRRGGVPSLLPAPTPVTE